MKCVIFMILVNFMDRKIVLLLKVLFFFSLFLSTLHPLYRFSFLLFFFPSSIFLTKYFYRKKLFTISCLLEKGLFGWFD